MGDRVQQTVNGVPETYALDIASGLTQVLEDGTNAYLYGVERIAQQGTAEMDYFHTDVLGSMRQLTDASGDFILHYPSSPSAIFSPKPEPSPAVTVLPGNDGNNRHPLSALYFL
jgi:hypothetical protein